MISGPSERMIQEHYAELGARVVTAASRLSLTQQTELPLIVSARGQ